MSSRVTWTREQVAGVILAGGQGSRMGGVDKGLVELHERPMIAHVIERFSAQTGDLVLNVNRSHDQYAAFSLPMVSDELAGFAGPLAGIAAAMLHFQTATLRVGVPRWMATVPCDSPFLPTDCVARLADEMVKNEAEIAVARTPSGPQPVFALYDIGLIHSLQTFLATGRRKIDVWTAQHRTIHVEFDDEKAFSNINSMADLQAF